MAKNAFLFLFELFSFKETEKLILAGGTPAERILKVLGPMENEEVPERIVKDTLNKFGRIDVLVGVILSWEQFRESFASDLGKEDRYADLIKIGIFYHESRVSREHYRGLGII